MMDGLDRKDAWCLYFAFVLTDYSVVFMLGGCVLRHCMESDSAYRGRITVFCPVESNNHLSRVRRQFIDSR